LLFTIAYLVIGFEKELLVALLFISILVIITQTDIEAMIIPNSIVFTGIIGAVLIRVWIHPYPLWDHIVAFFVGSGILLLLGWTFQKLLKKEAMGGGDIKLYAFIGLVLGIQLTILSLLLASVIGFIFGIAKKLRNTEHAQA